MGGSRRRDNYGANATAAYNDRGNESSDVSDTDLEALDGEDDDDVFVGQHHRGILSSSNNLQKHRDMAGSAFLTREVDPEHFRHQNQNWYSAMDNGHQYDIYGDDHGDEPICNCLRGFYQCLGCGGKRSTRWVAVTTFILFTIFVTISIAVIAKPKVGIPLLIITSLMVFLSWVSAWLARHEPDPNSLSSGFSPTDEGVQSRSRVVVESRVVAGALRSEVVAKEAIAIADKQKVRNSRKSKAAAHVSSWLGGNAGVSGGRKSPQRGGGTGDARD